MGRTVHVVEIHVTAFCLIGPAYAARCLYVFSESGNHGAWGEVTGPGSVGPGRKTPLDLPREAGREDIAQLLQQHGAGE